MAKPTQATVLVTEQEQLETLCRAWLQLPLVALDTEFMRTNTYYPIPALIQVCDGQYNYLIDPLSVTNLACLGELLTAGSVCKALHACSEDLEVFHRLLNVLPVNLLDTQVAAGFNGNGFSVGYGALVETYLDIQLHKEETRSDWLQRPLTDAQLLYAAEDVAYLFPIAQQLIQSLETRGRLAWVMGECQQLIQNYQQAMNPGQAFTRFRGAWRLAPRHLEMLKQLAEWRDRTAQERDVPRSYVIKDKALFHIAETAPSQASQLRKIPELPDKVARRYGETVLSIVSSVESLKESELPEALPRSPNSRQQNLIKVLRQKIGTVAEELEIAPECLVRKKDYEFIVRAMDSGATGDSVLPPSFQGWRREILQPAVLSVL